ncbi:MAG: hypothetical protein IJZ20_07230 [Clostridia bacterium]|nr:hypothetical protein [Clostridia bacterium]
MSLYITKNESASGMKVVLDDMILTKDMPTTAGSKMLEGYVSLFEAEVVTKLAESGFEIAGKANVGEMALDLLGETSYFGACKDEKGSLTSAAAEAVKTDDAFASIVLDVNGYPRRASAVSGLVYVKPTYGTVSRYGVIPAACSGDTVGVMAKTASDVKTVLTTIAGHDDKDGTSLPEEKCALLHKTAEKTAVKKIALAKNFVDAASDEVKANVDAFVAKCKANGIEVVEVDAKLLETAKAAWNILMSAELCNNVSKYDGVKYGYRSADSKSLDDLYTNSRTEAFGYLLKSTILYGSDTLSTDNYMKVYDRALRVRRVICEYFASLFNEYDAVLLPACSKAAYTVEEATADKYIANAESLYTAPASISGLPAVVTDGVQLIGKAFSENSLLDLADIK